MDDLVSVNQIGSYKLIELQAYANAQYESLIQAQEKIKSLERQVTHLKELLSTTPLADTVSIIVSDEQTICEMEIQRLKETSFKRGLTLEETKRFDLCVKNLQLIKEGKKQDIVVPFKNLAGISQQTLIEIASTPDAVVEE